MLSTGDNHPKVGTPRLGKVPTCDNIRVPFSPFLPELSAILRRRVCQSRCFIVFLRFTFPSPLACISIPNALVGARVSVHTIRGYINR